MNNNKFYLDCPYDEKDMCKRIGALWDVEKKKWYVPDTLDRDAFKRWWPKGVEQNKKSHLKVIK